MIRWCAFCQRLVGECAPYQDYAFTHGICDICAPRLERGEPLSEMARERLAFFRELLAAASERDLGACRELVERASSYGMRPSDVAVGLLQPLLYDVGRRWEAGAVSVADEHQITRWCESFLDLLPFRAVSLRPFDLLVFMAPGNRHVIGARMTEGWLQDRGYACQAIVPELPVPEIVARTRSEYPRQVGFSCASDNDLQEALRAVDALRGAGYDRPVVLGGLAVRGSPVTVDAPGVRVCVSLDELPAALGAAEEQHRA